MNEIILRLLLSQSIITKYPLKLNKIFAKRLAQLFFLGLNATCAYADDVTYSSSQETNGSSRVYEASTHTGVRSVVVNNSVILSSLGGGSSGSQAVAIDEDVLSFINNGTIQSDYYTFELGSSKTLSSLVNNGSITQLAGGCCGNNAAITIGGSTITTLTNMGAISSSGLIDINNTAFFGPLGTIQTLNNLQGASSSALRYLGKLPTNYNIVINSQIDHGMLAASSPSGNMTFGIYSTSIVSAGARYQDVLSGISAANITNENTVLTYRKGNVLATYSLVVDDLNVIDVWDLLILSYLSGPSAIDTQSSLHNSAQRLRSIFNSAALTSNFANMNTYDCNLFDAKGMCISVGGRYTTVDNPNSNTTSAVVVVGFKASPNIRIGGFLDRSVNNNTPTGINVSNKNPLMGAFAVWNQQADGLGYQVKVANAYQDKDVITTRDVIGTSEAGTGATDLNTQSYVGELSYAYLANEDKTTLRPYLALRQTTIRQDAYTETGVANPLSYASLKDRSTTALVGLKLNHILTLKATLTASLGVEQDLVHRVDQYSATSSSIANLTSENFNDNIKRTRPVASAGAYYALSKTQRISGDVYYQQLPFQSTGSTTAYFSYMIGL